MLGRPHTVETKSAIIRCEGSCPPTPGRRAAVTDHKFTRTDTGEAKNENNEPMPIGFVLMKCLGCGTERIWGSFRTKDKGKYNFSPRGEA